MIQPKTERILVVMLGGIGNLILMIPALRALRQGKPHGRITLMVGEPGVEAILEEEGLFDDVVCRPSGGVLNFAAQIRFMIGLRRKRFDTALVASHTNVFKGSLLTWSLGIPCRVGEYKDGWGWGYTVRVPYVAFTHETEGSLRLVEALGIRVRSEYPRLSIGSVQRQAITGFLLRHNIQDMTLIGLHVGSGMHQAYKRWPHQKFIALARSLAKDRNVRIVLVGGPAEVQLARYVAAAIGSSAICAAGQIDVRTTTVLIERCALFISNDSGPAHIAAAVGTPLIALFGPTEVFRIAPRGRSVRIIHKEPLWGERKARTMARISEDEVLAVAHEMLGSQKPGMPKLKVLHLITRLDHGGSGYNTLETVARLDRKKYNPVLVCGLTRDPDGRIKQMINERGIHIIYLTDLRREVNPWYDLKAFVALYQLIKRGGYDCVHTHSSKAGILGRWAAWATGTEYIVHTPHGHVFYGYFNKWVSAFYIWCERQTAKITDRIITLTHKGKKDHVEYGIDESAKFVQIYSGIDLRRYKNICPDTNAFRSEFHIPKNTFIFGSVARLDPIKGHQYLIEAMPEVVRRAPYARLLLIGDGSEREALHARVQDLGLASHVIFTGFRDDVPTLTQWMDVFVLSSLNEGMGRVLLEAMACGKPVIATRVGGIPEIVQDGVNGVLVPPADPAAMAKAMLKLCQNKDLACYMGREGLSRAGEKFSLKSMVDGIEHLYNELLEAKQ